MTQIALSIKQPDTLFQIVNAQITAATKQPSRLTRLMIVVHV